MTTGVETGIGAWAASLGDFPLDPDRGRAWLWSGDGAGLLWMSPDAAKALEAAPDAVVDHGGALQSFALELRELQPDRQPIRVKQLDLKAGARREAFTCLCRHVPLKDGSGYGLLTVAIGAPPRLANRPAPAAAPVAPRPPEVAAPPAAPKAPAAVAQNAEPARVEAQPPEKAPTSPAPGARAAHDVAAPASEQDVSRMKAAEAPERGETGAGEADADMSPAAGQAAPPEYPAAPLRPLRFVWQTDAAGVFVHLSRELGEAVGHPQAMLIGRTMAEARASLGLGDAGEVEAALAGRRTWTAKPVLWPTADGARMIPVEMAGLPVLENGVFAGFRGYGVARVDAALPAAPASRTRVDAAGTTSPAAEPAPMADAAAPQAEGARDDEAKLSASERHAFREIARVLGAERDGPQTPEAREPEPPALDPAGPPPLAPHEMPAWIARRQLALRAGEARPETPAEPASLTPLAPRGSGEEAAGPRRRETRLARLLDRLPLAALVMREGKALHANPAFLDLAGYPDLAAATAEGALDSFFTPGEQGARPPGAGALLVRDRQGAAKTVDSRIAEIDWDDGPASLLTFALRPESAPPPPARVLPDPESEALRAERDELRMVLDTASDGVLFLDGEGRILSMNRPAEALFSVDQKEVAGEHLTALLQPESHGAVRDYLDRLAAGGVAAVMNDGREVLGRERGGGAIPLFMTLGRLSGAPGRARFCAVLRDVTSWKKAEAELTEARRAAEDANANKTAFLARVSHEIRTPMNAIIGFADVMRNETFGPLGDQRYKGYANDIHLSGQHVVSLVNDLLDLSKVSAGKLDLTFSSVNLNEAVANAVTMIQPQANAGRVIVRTQLAEALPPVVADERSIRQIVLNLLSNAAKFTEPGGQVVVSTSISERGEAAIRVRDTGVGMTEDELKRALEPFRQVAGPKTAEGTGLGLPLTKALAEANRARFAISSEPGKGTLAEIVFPSTRVLAE